MAELGVANLGALLDNVKGGQVVLFHEAAGDEDGVLVVVPSPGNETDQEVLTQGQLSFVGTGVVGDDLPRLDPVTLLDDGPLGHHGVLVRASILQEVVEVGSDGDVPHLLLPFVLDLDDDSLGVDLLDDTGPSGNHDGSATAAGDRFDSGPHHGGVGPDQGDRLTLHVRTHEGTVGVVVLQEGDEPRR